MRCDILIFVRVSGEQRYPKFQILIPIYCCCLFIYARIFTHSHFHPLYRKSRCYTVASMLQAVLVSPTAKLDISRLVEHSPSPSPSPSPPPTSTTSLPPLSRSFSIPATVDQSRVNTSHNTSSIPQYYATTGVSHPVPHQEVLAPLSTVVSGNKRTASSSPHELQQPNKKPPRQWSDSDSDELVKLRGQNMKWEDIARRFPNRSHVACRLRYQNYMERKYHWTDDKNGKLARLYER